MKVAALASLFLAAVSAHNAALILPTQHHARFLLDRAELEAELAAWKASPAGREARAHGLYPAHSISSSKEDHLARLFLSKLTIEQASLANPNATFGLNSPFTLMTNEEFATYVGRAAGTSPGRTDDPVAVHESAVVKALPESVDHTTGPCVGPVKNQGKCGSCWSFSAIATMESAVCTKTGTLHVLAEQQLVSCDKTSSSQGCDGGWPKTGLAFATKNGGICSASSYPYTSGTTGDSAYSTCAARTSNCTTVPFTVTTTKVSATETGYLTALAERPLSVAVTAGNPSWKQYTSGIVSSCSTMQLDHAVVAVGYDTTSFKIKNSWGTTWGEGGFIRLARVKPNKAACGLINPYSVYATAE